MGFVVQVRVLSLGCCKGFGFWHVRIEFGLVLGCSPSGRRVGGSDAYKAQNERAGFRV